MKKVLIVDDSDILRHQVATALRAAAFEVVEAVDGVDGLAKLAEHSDIAMIVSDLRMPRMDGLEMLRTLKAMPEHASLPVLMLTTEGHVEHLTAAKRAGARGWIVKPFVPRALVAAVERLTGRGAGAPSVG